ncbi:MAG TPA: ATP-dependent 6-phosphofructokinase [Candidatus Thermoplasmatota archaeon]|nr:ATP-dependent 6-phosphofructokinase [Candidatus Thermoplasmatota archaeon]
MRIGILTGGGDAPGLNAVIRGLVVRATQLGHTVIGIRHGWRGVLEADGVPLKPADVEGVHRQGGTLLKTSRTNPVKDDAIRKQALAGYKKLKIDALVAVGGDDTLGACAKLAADGIKAIGVPKTIDNDLSGTDMTFGFDTAANIAMEALDRLHTTAESHERCLVVEIMGRHAGWITYWAGLAGGAHVVLLPEDEYDPAEVAKVVEARDRAGHGYTLVAIAEGAKPKGGPAALQTAERDQFGNVRLGGVAEQLAKEIEKRTKKETRHVVLGHLQRGGAPSAFDRVYGTRLGVAAAELAHEKRFGVMLALRGNRLEAVPLSEAAQGYRLVPESERRLTTILRGL